MSLRDFATLLKVAKSWQSIFFIFEIMDCHEVAQSATSRNDEIFLRYFASLPQNDKN
ncbi:hypothetical protein ACWIUD_10585 [Helicobacter sp. 23-1044]